MLPHAARHPGRLALIVTLVAVALALPASAQAGCPDGTQGALRCLINKERGKRDMKKLKQRDTLEAAAYYHASDMAARGYFSHNSPDGSSSWDRAVAFGYVGSGSGGVGEVIAEGTLGWAPAATVREWMSSGMHRDVILDRRSRHIGIGVVTLNNELIYVVDVGHH